MATRLLRRWWAWLIAGVLLGVLVVWIVMIPVPSNYECVHTDTTKVTCGQRVYPP